MFNLIIQSAEKTSYSDIERYIDNLSRLRIIEIEEDGHIAAKDAYKALESNSLVVNLMKEKLAEDEHREIFRKYFVVTAFGHKFVDVCVKDL